MFCPDDDDHTTACPGCQYMPSTSVPVCLIPQYVPYFRLAQTTLCLIPCCLVTWCVPPCLIPNTQYILYPGIKGPKYTLGIWAPWNQGPKIYPGNMGPWNQGPKIYPGNMGPWNQGPKIYPGNMGPWNQGPEMTQNDMKLN